MAQKKQNGIRHIKDGESVNDYLESIDMTLLSYKDFYEVISIHHKDGSFLYFPHARHFLESGQHSRLFVWTEHLGSYAFHIEEITNYIITR